jgi:broad specificity phosphatase PhoE
LVRHAQGEHNVGGPENINIPDPELTADGRAQCATLARSFAYHDRRPLLLVSSPLRRTLQTCQEAFCRPSRVGRDARDGDVAATDEPVRVILALPEIQEIGTIPCDIGSDVEALRNEFGDAKLRDDQHAHGQLTRAVVDLSRLGPGWADKGPQSKFEPTLTKLTERAVEARRILREMGRKAAVDKKREIDDGNDIEVHVVAVAHGGILQFMSQDWHGIPDDRSTTRVSTLAYISPLTMFFLTILYARSNN